MVPELRDLTYGIEPAFGGAANPYPSGAPGAGKAL